MSDAEHELIVDLGEVQADAENFRDLARRALLAALTAQEAAYDRHDEWIDEGLRDTAPEDL